MRDIEAIRRDLATAAFQTTIGNALSDEAAKAGSARLRLSSDVEPLLTALAEAVARADRTEDMARAANRACIAAMNDHRLNAAFAQLRQQIAAVRQDLTYWAQPHIPEAITKLDAALSLLTKHGATGFAYGRDDSTRSTRVMFRLADRMCRFDVTKPDVQDFRRTPTGLVRSLQAATQLADAEERRRWRALVLVVKALLVGVADGVISLSDAFLPYTVLPNGATVGEWAAPQLDTAYATAQMPALMPGGDVQPQRVAIEGGRVAP